MRGLIKEVCACSIFYLTPRSALQRISSLTILSLFVTLIGLYIWYTLALRLHLPASWIFNQHQFQLIDRSYAEFAGYALETLTILLFTLKAVRDKQFLWLSWAAIFMVILIDDSMQLHESFGKLVKANLNVSKNIGEIIGFAWLGLFVSAFWLMGLFQIPKNARGQLTTYLVFSMYLGLLIFFGVFIDAFHILIARYDLVPDALVELIEDGGELLMTCLCAITAISFYADTPKTTTV